MHFTWKANAVYTVTWLFMVYQMSGAFTICTMKTTLTSHAHHTQGLHITENSIGQFLLVGFVLCLFHNALLFVKSMLTSWGDPDSPVNLRRSVSGYTEGDTVTCTCNTGYIQAQSYLLYIFSNYIFRFCLDHNGNPHACLPMSSVFIRCVFQSVLRRCPCSSKCTCWLLNHCLIPTVHLELELFLYQTKREMSPVPSFGKILNSSFAYCCDCKKSNSQSKQVYVANNSTTDSRNCTERMHYRQIIKNSTQT